MVVCLCKGVNDKTIQDLVNQGATSVKEIMATCKAGSDCGSCICQVKDLVAKARGMKVEEAQTA